MLGCSEENDKQKISRSVHKNYKINYCIFSHFEYIDKFLTIKI
jgi:hypothetical protein